ncbi:MAG TPA: integrase core domain-containing protein, partial [Nocardioidaceae bacterium]|nr:integrase core domain-containing protein [Nocardioidaceae bacterium]
MAQCPPEQWLTRQRNTGSRRAQYPFPESFASLAHARQFCAGFFHEYNYIHRHSGIAWHTPASVHFGTADAI